MSNIVVFDVDADFRDAAAALAEPAAALVAAPTTALAEPAAAPAPDCGEPEPSIASRIEKWLALFDKYAEVDADSCNCIAQLNALKVNLGQLIGRQKKDDVQFYQSIIENSHFYLVSSLRVRRAKFLCDVSAIWHALRPGSSLASAERSVFLALTRDIARGHEEIARAHRNCTTLAWVKKDQIDTLREVEADLEATLQYHNGLLAYFNTLAKLELAYFSSHSR